jgi:hypothetical protein
MSAFPSMAGIHRYDEGKRFMNRARGSCSKLLIAMVGCVAFGALAASSARADFGISEFGVSTSINGALARGAGAHPDFRTVIAFPREPMTGNPDGTVRDVNVDLPVGLTGNPSAAATCGAADLVGGSGGASPECPLTSQVGIALVSFDSGGSTTEKVPVYNMKAPNDLPGLFALNLFGAVVQIEPSVRPSDYGISALSTRISQANPLYRVDLTLWGVPASRSHDADRYRPFAPGKSGGFGLSSPAPDLPFMTNPTSCPSDGSVFSAAADSWRHPGLFSAVSVDSDLEGIPFRFNGCAQLAFEPSFTATPGSHRAAAPTGLAVDVTVPQNEGPAGLATAHVRKTVVTLPKGVSISPSSAAGLGSCSPEQIGLGTNIPPTCPGSSSLGSVEIETPLLAETLRGELFLAKQGDNPFNSLLAIYIAVRGPGFYLKLPGKVEADPRTGQLTTTFDGTPQLPFGHLHLTFRGGPAAPLVAPESCGTFDTHVEMTSWASSIPVQLDTPMTINEGCNTGGFNPGLKAGTTSPIAGAFSPFTLQVTRQDGEQNISRIEATLPEGVLAKLAGVPVCADAQAVTGACPAASQVGTTMVGAGGGFSPLYVPEAGKAPTAVYLGGPYKGAPYSLVVKVPAQAGPFDLGTVTVRNALNVDPVTAQVTAKSDPLPQILEGIPLAYRDIRVEATRDDFTINPTSCEPMKVASTIFSAAGASASPSAPFQVADCEALGFQPKLALRVFGKTNRNAKPRFRAVLTTKAGEANIGRAQVNLPHSEFLEQAHIKTTCTRVQFNAGAGHGAHCPQGSIYGQAKASTPLLDKPLQGPVYLRASSHKLPDLVAALNGQIDVELASKVDSGSNAGLRSTFELVPDAPVSKFILELEGGKKGLLVNSENLCSTGAETHASVRLTSQNGKVLATKRRVANSCGAKKGKGRHK